MLKRGLIVLALFLATVSRGADQEGGTVALSRPDTSGGMSVTEAIARRRSHRDFEATALTSDEIAQLCWAAQGITDPARARRAAPSAGALYPMAVYVVDRRGIFEYLPDRHALRRVATGDERGKLQAAALGQAGVGGAPLCMVLTMNVEITAAKYGRMATRYCLLEAGHIAQNVMLQATGLGLGGVTVGAFEGERVAALLKLPQGRQPVYLLPLGHPR
ncbi:MAG: SagB/ThcOx family dehydrogenase [Planctomycetota bacterium]|jgi:SagB-type dehydrogenase family enzyme